MERRYFARLPVSLDVSLVIDQSPTAKGRTLNIGPGGMFVSTNPSVLSGNTEVEVEFSTRTGTGSKLRTHRIPVSIAYSTPNGLGLRFVESDESEYQVSHTLLGMLCSPASVVTQQ